RYEPFGLAPLEAALAGCALVLADIPTYRELWEGCGEFYPPGDAAALAAAIRGLMDAEGRRRALAEAARARAAERYSPERMARQYEALYRELAAAPAAAPRVAAHPRSCPRLPRHRPAPSRVLTGRPLRKALDTENGIQWRVERGAPVQGRSRGACAAFGRSCRRLRPWPRWWPRQRS